jgi:hypothetical protein
MHLSATGRSSDSSCNDAYQVKVRQPWQNTPAKVMTSFTAHDRQIRTFIAVNINVYAWRIVFDITHPTNHMKSSIVSIDNDHVGTFQSIICPLDYVVWSDNLWNIVSDIAIPKSKHCHTDNLLGFNDTFEILALNVCHYASIGGSQQ